MGPCKLHNAVRYTIGGSKAIAVVSGPASEVVDRCMSIISEVFHHHRAGRVFRRVAPRKIYILAVGYCGAEVIYKAQQRCDCGDIEGGLIIREVKVAVHKRFGDQSGCAFFSYRGGVVKFNSSAGVYSNSDGFLGKQFAADEELHFHVFCLILAIVLNNDTVSFLLTHCRTDRTREVGNADIIFRFVTADSDIVDMQVAITLAAVDVKEA